MREIRPCKFILRGPSPLGHAMPYDSRLVPFLQENACAGMHLCNTGVPISHISANNVPVVIKSHQFSKQKVVHTILKKVDFIPLFNVFLFVYQIDYHKLVYNDLNVLACECESHMRVSMDLAVLMLEVDSRDRGMMGHLLSHILPAVSRYLECFSRKRIREFVDSVLKVSKDGDHEC